MSLKIRFMSLKVRFFSSENIFFRNTCQSILLVHISEIINENTVNSRFISYEVAMYPSFEIFDDISDLCFFILTTQIKTLK